MAQFEVALAFASMGRTGDTILALKRAVRLNPKLAAAWRELGDQLTIVGDTDAADDAYINQIKASVHDPRLLQAATALDENKLAVAERLLRTFLKEFPTDVPAIRMLAEAGLRLGRSKFGSPLRAMPRTCAQLSRRAPRLCAGASPDDPDYGGARANGNSAEAGTNGSQLSQSERRRPGAGSANPGVPSRCTKSSSGMIRTSPKCG